MGRTFHPLLTIIFRPAAFLIGWLLCGATVKAGPGAPAIPADLSTRLQRDRTRDDLQDWVYDQIQWVAALPSARAMQLNIAVRTAWRGPHTAEEHQAWLDLLINQGYALLQAGDIVASTDAYSAALDWARSHSAVADPSLVLNTILKPLGNNYTRLGDYEEADFIQHQALRIAVVLQDRESLAGAYGNLANTAASRGDPQRSLEYCRLGLQEIPGRSPYRGLLLSEEADALFAMKDAASARRSITEAIAILRAARRSGTASSETGTRGTSSSETGTHETGSGGTRAGNDRFGPSASSLDNWLFVACRQAGDIDSAFPQAALYHYREALQVAAAGRKQQTAVNRRELAKLFLRLGEWYQGSGRPAAAIRNLDESLSTLVPGKDFTALTPADLFAENTLADALYARARLAGADPAFGYRCYRLSFLTEGLMRKQLITGVSRERAVADSKSRHEAAIQAAWAEWTRSGSHAALTAMLEFMESSKAQLLLDELLQEQRMGISAVTTGSVYRRVRMLEQALIYYQEQGLLNAKNDSLAAAILARRRQTERDLASALKSLPGRDPGANRSPDGAPEYLPGDGTEIRSFFAGAHALYQIGLDSKGIAFAEREPMGRDWQDSLRQFLRTWFEQGPAN
ncbi:MAG TPA: tetratricopeptide repeat protein, partial [Puia sp.]|nr:tetratricopeptide repeat protein [Puia sp.]